jgi:plasmid stability protein
MATIHVRDVPHDIAEIIAAKAAAEQASVSAYLRKLMAADAEVELRKRAMRQWLGDLGQLHRDLGLPRHSDVSGAELVRQAREEYEREHA